MVGEHNKLRDQILAQGPTDQQREAIFTDDLEFLLRAAPGSGKTWTSCRRFIWRGANWTSPAGGLALLSFTNAAIREFHQATIKVGRRDLLSDPNYVGTFDAFVERYIISPFGHLIAGLSIRPKLFNTPRPGDWNNNKLKGWVELSRGRRRPVPAWEIIPYPEAEGIAFKASSKFGGNKLQFSGRNPVFEFMKLGFYTHEQRVFWASTLLTKRPHIAGLIARRFPEIVIDEAQDCNVWLIILLNIIRNKGAKVTLIGDPDQCIYEFAMADARSLLSIKEQWNIPERPLSKSFRCNNQIAAAVRNIGMNEEFGGCGECILDQKRPLIIRESNTRFASSVAGFQKTLQRIGVNETSSAIVCRGHRQLKSIYGEVTYTELQGKAKDLAEASFYRDCRKDYKRAAQIVEKVVRSIVGDNELWERIDENPESQEGLRSKLILWRFVKSKSGLPSVTLSGSNWISHIRLSLGVLMSELGITNAPNINRMVTKKGLDDKQVQLPLLMDQTLFPSIRQETIHQVKGESINAVLVLGSSSFWDSVVNSVITRKNTEDRRLAYVAMTRARHFLALGLPASHFDQYKDTWAGWGFEIYQ